MKPAPPFQSLPRGYVHPPQECCLAPTCTVERQQKFSEDWKKGHAILPECKAKKIEEIKCANISLKNAPVPAFEQS